MRHLLLCTIGSILIWCVGMNASAQSTSNFQKSKKDSVPSRILQKVAVTIKDLADGYTLDSVLVTAGVKKGYTDNKGFVEFDSVYKETLVTASKNGYLLSSKKAKPAVTIRLAKREQSSVARVDNGLYQRPIDHFSGAVTVVSGTELRKVNALNFVEALKFYAPSFVVTTNNNYGDNPNVPPSAKIRNTYSFPPSATIVNQSNTNANIQLAPSTGDFIADNVANPDQPVILLDGVQVDLQSALDIDINRIDKVTILKDASATAQYGVRGGTGVLLVQTRKPKPGNFSITYSGQVQITTPDLSSYNFLSAPDKLQLEKTAGLFTNNDALYQKRLYLVNKGVNTDWLSIPTRNGVGTKHYLALEGGDDDISYGLDFSYNNIQGVMEGASRKNTNVGGYINTRIKTLNINNYFSYTTSSANNSPYGSLKDYVNQNPYWNPYDSVKGGFAKVLEQYTSQGSLVRNYNPAYNGTLSTKDSRVYSRLSDLLSLNWNIGYGFKFDGRLSFNKQFDEENVFLPPGHTTFGSYPPEDFFKRGIYNQTSSDFLSAEAAFNLNYTKRIALHQFYASAGMSGMQTNSESAAIQLAGFTSDRLTDIAFGKAYSNSKPETGMIKTRLASAYGNFTYSYDNRYQVEVTGNADESSQFGRNNPVAPHWSVGASWNLHQERFFHESKILNSLHLRGSIGTAGNLFYQSYLNQTSFDYYTDRQYIQGGSSYGNHGIGLGAYLTGYANDDLKSPVTEKQNLGLDAVLLQNRLFISVDAYRNKTTDIVLPVSSPTSTGFLNFNYYDNLGAIESKGVEFNLNYRIINDTRKGIAWSVIVNGIHNEDRIKSISNYLEDLTHANDGPLVDQTRLQPHYLVDQSPTAIWAVRSLGIDAATGKEKFLNADGTETFTWSTANKTFAGDLAPQLQGSFGTTVTVKNISAGIYCNYQFGASYYNQTLADYVENADINYNVDARAAKDRWTQPGDVALYKALSVNGLATSPTNVTTRFVGKNDFINCSAVSLSYSLPENIVSKVSAKYAKIGFIANNAFHTSTMEAQKGINYPFQRMYTFIITTSF
jgi:TonB-linked SusC/RagA family outer membrane protein